MNFLLLVNNAPHHRPFFSRVGARLEEMGHQVVYAADSKLSEFTHPEAILPKENTHVFSEYFQRGFGRGAVSDRFRRLNVWTALFPDLDRAEYSSTMLRRRPGYYERLAESLITFFAEIIETAKIDAVVYESVSNAFAYVAYQVARELGVRYVGFGMSRLPGRIDVTDQAFFRHSRTEEVYRSILSGDLEVPKHVRSEAEEYLRELDKQKPDYVTVNGFMTYNPLRRYARWSSLRSFAAATRCYLSDPAQHEFAFQTANPFVIYPEHFARETVRWVKSLALKRWVQKPGADDAFFVYPLQYHPESSCAVDGAYFNDDLVNIINTAMNLPMGHCLYVKDHPYAFGQAPTALYRRVLRIPNVRFIDWTIDSKALIRKARAVVTSTSSFGYEAVLLGKPVFVLGHPFYDFHPLVRRISSWDDAFESFSKYADVRATDAEVRAFVEAYFMTSHAGSYDLKSNSENANAIGLIADLVVAETSKSAPRTRAPLGATNGVA